MSNDGQVTVTQVVDVRGDARRVAGFVTALNRAAQDAGGVPLRCEVEAGGPDKDRDDSAKLRRRLAAKQAEIDKLKDVIHERNAVIRAMVAGIDVMKTTQAKEVNAAAAAEMAKPGVAGE